jgi:hypothetical protein
MTENEMLALLIEQTAAKENLRAAVIELGGILFDDRHRMAILQALRATKAKGEPDAAS